MRNVRGVVLALFAVTLGSMAALAQTDNTATGCYALHNNTSGSYNTADGCFALDFNTTGSWNTATGVSAMQNGSTGTYNVADGYGALNNNNGSYNSALGAYALLSNTTASGNTAVGSVALYSNTSGGSNTAIGESASEANTTGAANTSVGSQALYNNTTGSSNIAIGQDAGANITGNYNIDIGNTGFTSDSGAIRIGTSGSETSFFAAGIDGVTVSGGVEVFINSSGQLGTVNSSLRFKEDVHDMGGASSAIFRLRPVTYRYKQPYADGSKPIDYGLIAEEVAEVYPDLVVKGPDGQIQTVQYQKLTPMLLNELQKQHRLFEQMANTIQQQQETMQQQQETIQLLKAQQTNTVQSLEKRLAALETGQSSDRLEAHAAAQ